MQLPGAQPSFRLSARFLLRRPGEPAPSRRRQSLDLQAVVDELSAQRQHPADAGTPSKLVDYIVTFRTTYTAPSCPS